MMTAEEMVKKTQATVYKKLPATVEKLLAAVEKLLVEVEKLKDLDDRGPWRVDEMKTTEGQIKLGNI